ncbi:MAG: flagellin [Magnetospirillum sp.]|nr:flagellin [Magnetospirillum sp.]
MAGSITLSASSRSNLLALQSTASLVKQTQGRLSTGLKVASAIDDPVAYFQAKALADRASDFTAKKDSIDQGVSTLTAATNGVSAIESVVKQLQGLVLNAKSAQTSTEINNMVSQFNTLRTQIDKLANDASYQGLNLINATGATLSVSFSNDTTSKLDVDSVDITVHGKGLGINKVNALATANLGQFDGIGADFSARDLGYTLTQTGTLTVTLAMSADLTLTTANISGHDSITFSYGTTDVTLNVGASGDAATFIIGPGSSLVLQAGAVYTFDIADSGAIATTGEVLVTGIANSTDVVKATVDNEGATNLGVGYTESFNQMVLKLNANLTTIRAQAQTLGSNVAMLNTRLEFTTSYVNTLTAGSGKLNLADLNEEGANLLALQTRQQLGIQALSFAGQSEQAVLGLFR